MKSLPLHSFHQSLGGRFSTVGTAEVVAAYGPLEAEYSALRGGAGILDLSFRGRLCLTGADRSRFLHGQVTNSVRELKPGEGCYAALVTAKGKMVSDLQVLCLPDELLLDFEPGLSDNVKARLEQYIIADDVQVIDVEPHYGLLTVQGPKAAQLVQSLGLPMPNLPGAGRHCSVTDSELGEVCCVNQPRGVAEGYDLFVPNGSLETVARRCAAEAGKAGGLFVGWDALEMVRIEAGRPRFGQDMDDSNLAPEAGIEERAISYNKGCYIGQEVIARIRTYGQVAKALRGLKLPDEMASLPARGAPLLNQGREVGYLTSAVRSPACGNIALGYVRKECNQIGTVLDLSEGLGRATIVPLPFVPSLP